jgi:hypothetical protein
MALKYLSLTSGLKPIALSILVWSFGLLLAATGAVLAQYPLLPVHPSYRGPSGEPGQIILAGAVKKVTFFHGGVDDEADWHVYIDLEPKATTDLHSYLWGRGYTFINNNDCNKKEDCNLDTIYSEVMVCDRHRSTSTDEFFYSADVTLPFLLSDPEKPKVLLGDLLSEWKVGHPAWNLGLIVMHSQGIIEGSSRDFSEYSQLDGGRALLQGAFVEDGAHRVCIPPLLSCDKAHAKTMVLEIHPLDSIAFAMNEAGGTIPAKRGQPGWPTRYVKWRVAFFTNSKYHRIDGESYLKKERTTTWYLDLPEDAYNSWGASNVTIDFQDQRQQLWDGSRNSWYALRGVKSYAEPSIVIDPKDGKKKLKVSATMNIPDNWGGRMVHDYVIRVTLHSNPDLGIRVSNSNYADAQFATATQVSQNVPGGGRAVYYVRGHNQGPVPIQFRFKGIPGSSGWTVRYFDAPTGGNNITSQLTGSSGWLSPIISGGGSTQEIRIEVIPSSNLANGAEKLVRVWAESNIEPARKDIVEALTKVGRPQTPIP